MTKAGYIAMTLALGLRPDEALQMELSQVNRIAKAREQQAREAREAARSRGE